MSMARGVRDQGGISQMFNEDFHTCMFACFLSQEEPKRIHQALKDPSWIEAMQEELLQFKMQKVWILVDLPYGKRAIGKSASTPIDAEKLLLKDSDGEDAYFPAVSSKVSAVWSDELFWTTVAVKKVNDVTRLQALVDKKKVVVTEATIRDALRLDDAE
nr:putative ribonuclease H-like domain-containing protein [Tanacetum cinerariifolium]